ncbi:MAG TPA: GAF domain-containing protein [Allosphingosinicella sp.]|nr:GAF domain-containing protein [Allosphingosinicella sp.]
MSGFKVDQSKYSDPRRPGSAAIADRARPIAADISPQLYGRVAAHPNFMGEARAIQALAACMAEQPAEVLPRFVALARELTGADSAGLSLLETEPAPGVFRWRCLHGALAPFDDAVVPRDDSPCGITLERNAPVLMSHPERHYGWAAAAGVVVPEVLLVPLHVGGGEPLGTLWVVAAGEGHFNREHARLLGELSFFAGIALRMVRSEAALRQRLAALEGDGA